MIFPPGVLKNGISFNVAELKANQGPLTGPLAKVLEQEGGLERFKPDIAEMKEREAQAKEREAKKESRVAAETRRYDEAIAKAERSGDSSKVSDMRRNKRTALVEARFEDENGFRRKANTATKILYNKAQSNSLKPFHFKTQEEASTFASSKLSGFSNYARMINNYGGGDPSVGGAYQPKEWKRHEGYDEYNNFFEKREVMMEDSLQAARMRLAAEAQVLAKSFGIDEPIYEVSDGKLQIREFDIEYRGQKLLRSLGGGATAEYGANGALTVDKYA